MPDTMNVHHTELELPITGLAVDQSGTRIAVAQPRQQLRFPPITVFDTHSSDTLYEANFGLGIEGCKGIAFTPVGNLVSWTELAGHRHKLVQWHPESNQILWREISDAPELVTSLVLSPNGQTLLLIGEFICIYDLNRERVRTCLETHQMVNVYERPAVFDPSNRSLWSYATSPGIIEEFGLDGEPTGRCFKGPSDQGKAIEISPDGQVIAAIGYEGTRLIKIDDGSVIDCVYFDETPYWGGFTQDSSAYMFASGTLVSVDLATGTFVRGLELPGSGFTFLSASAGSAPCIAFLMQSGDLHWISPSQS